MCSELRSVVRCNCMQLLPLVWQQQPPCGLCRRFGQFALFEFRHEQEIGAALHHGQYGVLLPVHDKVHLPVSEALPVGLLGLLVYAHAVLYVGGLGHMPVRGALAVFHPVAAVGGKSAGLIGADELVDGLMGDAYALLPEQIAGYLAGRPLLVQDELPDAPDEFRRLGAVARLPVAATHCLLVRLHEIVAAIAPAVAPEFAADS